MASRRQLPVANDARDEREALRQQQANHQQLFTYIHIYSLHMTSMPSGGRPEQRKTIRKTIHHITRRLVARYIKIAGKSEKPEFRNGRGTRTGQSRKKALNRTFQ